MSRIGKQPVSIPDKVKVTVTGGKVLVEGPKGKVEKTFAPDVKVTVADKKVTFAPKDDSRFAWAMYGTARSIVAASVKPGIVGIAGVCCSVSSPASSIICWARPITQVQCCMSSSVKRG